MPPSLGDEIEIPDDDQERGWLKVRLLRRGTDEEEIVTTVRGSGRDPIRIPVWIVEILEGAEVGRTRVVPNGTVVKTSL
jgi:hypothetical protein